MRTRLITLMLLCAAIFTLSTGCASHEASTTASAGSVNPSAESTAMAVHITDFAGRSLAFSAPPVRIAALSNGDLNTVYALGGTLVGRPTSSHVAVPEAESVPQIGTTHSIDLEKLALLQPEVVLGNEPLNSKDIAAVESVGSQMMLTSANSVDDIKRQIELLGVLLDKTAKAQELIQELDARIAQLQSAQPADQPHALIVYGAPGTYMAALPNSISGNIAELVGFTNIAAGYPSLENYPQYAQLSTERIIEANPQYVFIMGHGNPEEVTAGFLTEMERNPAWNSIDAVVNNRVTVLPSDLFGSNPGARVMEALDTLQAIRSKAAAP